MGLSVTSVRRRSRVWSASFLARRQREARQGFARRAHERECRIPLLARPNARFFAGSRSVCSSRHATTQARPRIVKTGSPSSMPPPASMTRHLPWTDTSRCGMRSSRTMRPQMQTHRRSERPHASHLADLLCNRRSRHEVRTRVGRRSRPVQSRLRLLGHRLRTGLKPGGQRTSLSGTRSREAGRSREVSCGRDNSARRSNFAINAGVPVSRK